VATQALLILAPHPDDAALSCAALLDGTPAADILTVFAGGPDPPTQGWWDRRCGFASSTESVAARRREEESAFAGSGHRVRFLELPDEQYAGDVRPAEHASSIEAAIRKWTEGAPEGSVAVPAGAGWVPSPLRKLLGRVRPRRFAPARPGPYPSPDHVYLRDVALRELSGGGHDLLLYEELPYGLAEGTEETVIRAAELVGRSAEPLMLQVDRERKARRLSAYGSQIPHISPPGMRLDDPEALPPVERYWRLLP
jgi:LmbE family N-acetylglucosaminyl deacetylase